MRPGSAPAHGSATLSHRLIMWPNPERQPSPFRQRVAMPERVGQSDAREERGLAQHRPLALATARKEGGAVVFPAEPGSRHEQALTLLVAIATGPRSTGPSQERRAAGSLSAPDGV